MGGGFKGLIFKIFEILGLKYSDFYYTVQEEIFAGIYFCGCVNFDISQE